MKPEDITKERISRLIFFCPLKSEPVVVAAAQLEIQVQITGGKFNGAQLGIECQTCGKFHLSKLTEIVRQVCFGPGQLNEKGDTKNDLPKPSNQRD